MKILGIDSSGLVASVALLEDDQLLAEYTINHKKTHSQTLLPMLDEIVRMTDTSLDTIDAIAIAAGPGSFTGLRIGAATAKGLGLALDKPIIPVSTLEALAYNLAGTGGVICPMMDARRRQVYSGVYRFEKGRPVNVFPQEAIPVDALIDRLNRQREEVTVLGDGVPVYRAVLEEKLEVPVHFAPPHMNRQRAGSVASLGKQLYLEGKYESAADHKPEYLRVSQAERERAERERYGQEKPEGGAS